MPNMNIDSDTIFATVSGAVITAVAWVVRRVLTNEKKIAILENEMTHNTEQRKRMTCEVAEIKGDIKELLKRNRTD